jgi:hypothetical protein
MGAFQMGPFAIRAPRINPRRVTPMGKVSFAFPSVDRFVFGPGGEKVID